jgi:histidinol-phosphate aminotransferase
MNALMHVHGGEDAQGKPAHDFSTNVNSVGPCPWVDQAIRNCDASSYPDPGYTHLCQTLAKFHQVAPERILLAGSGSEFIQRMTALSVRVMPGPVAIPIHAYADYERAAHAWARTITHEADPAASLRWCADPCSPMGHARAPWAGLERLPAVLDLAYAPLRLERKSDWNTAALDMVFQLWSPAKSLGLAGIRGAYVIAPSQAQWPLAVLQQALLDAQPSWVLSTQAAALLEQWTQARTQVWLHDSRAQLRQRKDMLVQCLQRAHARVLPSITAFFCAQLPVGVTVQALREHGIKVRDTTSFGLPGWVRVSAQSARDVDALSAALRLCARKTA